MGSRIRQSVRSATLFGNINEFIALYNHYLRMIRDTTGINEAMDGTTPKGEQLVGVRQQAIAAGNNAIYDITNSSMVLFKKVCADIVKCLQILPKQSVIYKAYTNAIGEENMKVLNAFRDLVMFNFGVHVVKEMEEIEKQYFGAEYPSIPCSERVGHRRCDRNSTAQGYQSG